MISYFEKDLLFEKDYLKYDYVILPMNIYLNFGKYWLETAKFIFHGIDKCLLESSREFYGNKKLLGTITYTQNTKPFKENTRPTNAITCCFVKGFNFRPDLKNTNDEFDYDALDICFEKIKYIFGNKGLSFAMPRFDDLYTYRYCNWDIVIEKINKYFNDEILDIYTQNHQITTRGFYNLRKKVGRKSIKVEYIPKHIKNK